MQFIPLLALLNRYYLGDTVLLTGIAESLSNEYNTKVYVISNYSEILTNHPYAIPKSFDEIDDLPANCRIIDMSESIRSTKKEVILDRNHLNLERYFPLENKLARMYKQAGCYQRYIPRLYLDDKEREIAKNIKESYGSKLIGIGIGSRHDFKIWSYYDILISKLSQNNSVFLIDDSKERCKLYRHYPVINISDQSLREVMMTISAMDMVISNDSGIAHISAGLGIPTIVLGFKVWGELYEDYPDVVYLGSDVTGLKSIPVKWVLSVVGNLQSNIKIPKSSLIKSILGISTSKGEKPRIIKHNEVLPKSAKSVVFIRIRGLGDVLLTLPALKAFRDRYPHIKITYITSKHLVEILELTDLIDNVIGATYDHDTFGYPPPPVCDYKSYGRVYNLINRVDFEEDSYTTPRIQMFANLMGVGNEKLENYQIEVPQEWIDGINDKLKTYGVREEDTKIVMQVDSKGLSRQWKRIRQIEFCRLAMQKNYKVILVSDRKYDNYPINTVNLTGDLSLNELFALIKVADLTLAPDSGSVHIAGVLNARAIGLFGSIAPHLRISHYDTVQSIIGKAKCVPCNDWQRGPCDIAKSLQCMDSILARDVFFEVEKILKEGRVDNRILQSV